MKKNLLLLSLTILLIIIPLMLQKDSEFGGADGKAESAILEVNSHYEPWFESIWSPPGGETESLLFALQAAIGAGFIGYFIGFIRGKNNPKRNKG